MKVLFALIVRLFILQIFVQNTLETTFILPNSTVSWPPVCTNGVRQSPINFPSIFSKFNSAQIVQVSSVSYLPITSKITIQDNWRYFINATNMGTIKVNKNHINYSYLVKEINFVSGSEHSIGGVQGDLEIQILHEKDQNWLVSQEILNDPDVANKLLIVSVILKGSATAAIDQNIQRLNFGKGIGADKFELGIYPPIGKPFFYYMGSLTRPDCSENVDWIVVNEIKEIAASQITDFQNLISTSYKTKQNNRPVNTGFKGPIYYQNNPYQINYNNAIFIRNLKLMLVLGIYLIFFYLA